MREDDDELIILYDAQSTTTLSVIAFGVILAVARVYIGLTIEPEHMTIVAVYKDVAHLFIGGLAVAWWIQRCPWQWYLFWVLNSVEVATAIISRV